MNHIIQSNVFYILSGVSASGKSTFTKDLINKGLPIDAIVSTDTIRKQILGSYFTTDNYGTKEVLHGWDTNQSEIFSIIQSILEIRFKQRLPTIFDATNLDDVTREKYINLAKKHGVKSHVLIFDIEPNILKSRLKNRMERFDYSVIEKQLTKFNKSSIFPHSIVKENDNFILIPNLINTTKLDIVGDTHGLLDETINLLSKNNWKFKNKTFIHPDKERKVLFLGDAVDRGTQSIDLLEVIMNTEKNGQGLFILGNHEAKLISSYKQYIEEDMVRCKSFSSAQTVMKFLTLSKELQDELYQYLISTPTHYSLYINKKTNKAINIHSKDTFKNIESLEDYTNLINNTFKIGFGHANSEYFDPYRYTLSHALYGNFARKNKGEKIDTDAIYEKNSFLGINNYVFFRGHTLNTSNQNTIYSLEADQAFKGSLVMLNIENYINDIKENSWKPKHSLFEENIMKEKCEFDFNEHNKDKINLLKKMTELVNQGLVSDGWKRDEEGKKVQNLDGIKIFKYSKKVHFKRLWKKEPLLEKARGLAIDLSGNIVVHPFDKVYNYGEYDVGKELPLNKKVQVVEKLNGFLGCISKHPFKEELLFSTTGSFTSDYIQYIKDFVNEELNNDLLKYLSNNKQTLMFEVIHPKDKHIIEYDEKDCGLWLIGARGLNFTDKPVSEKELDIIGKGLNIRRPYWFESEFEHVLNNMLGNELEGYMIRDIETNDTLMKFKTNYYLITKFLGRMGPKMCSLMYKNPNHFKEHHVEEEFYSIVDKITSETPKEIFESMKENERVDFVRGIVDNLRKKVKTISTTNKL